MELLVGTNLYGAIVRRKDALYEVYCDLFPALSNEYPDLFPADVCTLYVHLVLSIILCSLFSCHLTALLMPAAVR